MLSEGGDEVLYVGSTSNLRARIAAHQSLTNRSNRPLYACIRGYGGWNAIEFRTLQMDVGQNLRMTRLNEQTAIERLRPIFNRNRAYSALSGTPYHRVYRAENRERFRAYNRQYQTNNRERINAQRRARRERQVSLELQAALVLESLAGNSE